MVETEARGKSGRTWMDGIGVGRKMSGPPLQDPGSIQQESGRGRWRKYFCLVIFSHGWALFEKKKKKTLRPHEELDMGFPGGSVVKNLATSAGDMGSIPDLGRSHMPQSN